MTILSQQRIRQFVNADAASLDEEKDELDSLLKKAFVR